MEAAHAIATHYGDIIASGKCINGCNARATSNAIDDEFAKRYPAKETDEHLSLVRVLGNAAWRGMVALYNKSPRYKDLHPNSTNGQLGYTVLLRGAETESRMLSLAIGLCLKSQTCANALLDCAEALGVKDEIYYHMLGLNFEFGMCEHKLIALVRAHPALLGRSSALALGYTNHCTVEYWLPASHFSRFVEQVKARPEWFAHPTFARNLASHAFADCKDAIRALRVLACLDPAFLHREQVDLGHLIEALKGNKAHMKRVEALAAKIEDPKHRDMAAEHTAAMAVVEA